MINVSYMTLTFLEATAARYKIILFKFSTTRAVAGVFGGPGGGVRGGTLHHHSSDEN